MILASPATIKKFGLRRGPGLYLRSAGTSEGATKGWDTRGRGTHAHEDLYDRTTATVQRGRPEDAMEQVQMTNGGGVLNPLVEHLGDLTHRMAEKVTAYNGGYEAVADKVKTCLRILSQSYGFEREMGENIQHNAEARGVPADQLRAKVYDAPAKYAEAHRAVPVHNEVQKLARDAAVDVGLRNFNGARHKLQRLKAYVDQGEVAWTNKAHEYDPAISQIQAGGPGSGCHGPNCGRPRGAGTTERRANKGLHAGPNVNQVMKAAGWTKIHHFMPPNKDEEYRHPKFGRISLKHQPNMVTVWEHPKYGIMHVYHLPKWQYEHVLDAQGNVVRKTGNVATKGKVGTDGLANYLDSLKDQPVEKPVAVSPEATTPVEVKLSTGTISSEKKMSGGGVHRGKVVCTFDDGTKALFKPESGAVGCRFNIPQHNGSYMNTERELGAWQVAKIVGMDDLVAPVVARDVGGQRGALLKWIDGKNAIMVRNPYDGKRDSLRAAVFDYVIGNTDRHDDNWIVTPKGKLGLIDHGLAFPESVYIDGNRQIIDHAAHFTDDITAYAKPYQDNAKEIVSTLKRLGLPKAAVDGVATRIGRLGNKYGMTFYDLRKDWI
jgi:Phosphatidylinositol 3- and 4-kinase